MFISKTTLSILKQAATLRKTGQVDEAIALLEDTRNDQFYTDYPAVLDIAMGECYLHGKREYRQAMSYYERALETFPDDRFALVGLGNCYLKLKNYDAAEPCFSRVLNTDPRNHFALKGLENINAIRQSSSANKSSFPNHHTNTTGVIAPQFGRTCSYDGPQNHQPQVLPQNLKRPDPPTPPVISRDVATRLEYAIQSLSAELNTSPRNVGKRARLVEFMIRAGHINMARKQALEILDIDQTNTSARKCLQLYPEDTPNHTPQSLQMEPPPPTDTPQRRSIDSPTPISTKSPPPPQDIVAIDEIVFTFLVNGQRHEITITLPASEGPVRLEFIDPERTNGEKGFTIARAVGSAFDPE